jgi:hypothetical protein
MPSSLKRRLHLGVAILAIAGELAASTLPAQAFCGFYVAQADAKLFNKSSKVVLAWDDGNTSVTMASDYEGDPKQFAVVIPVPTFIERKQIGIVDAAIIDHLDHFTAPRLVEYHDPDPCLRILPGSVMAFAAAGSTVPAPAGLAVARRKVVVEASYEVGEYDIQILSATESDGLVDYLTDNGYRIPEGADAVLGSYIRQKMHFFVAKVNLDRMQLAGGGFIRPLQVRYQTKKFMLPIRLGTVNATGPQDLIIYALTRHGRVETTNYRTVKMPSDVEVPLYVKDAFGDFYKASFERAVQRADMSAVFLEYAWNMGWCDPCAAQPLSVGEMQKLGARWLDEAPQYSGAAEAFATRLHVRYDATHFPEDLQLQETKDAENFQGRYVLRHPWAGASACPAGDAYRRGLPQRFETEAETLADLTGWKIADIRGRMETTGQSFAVETHDFRTDR